MKTIFTLLAVTLIGAVQAICAPSPEKMTGDNMQIASNLYIVTPTGSTVLMDGTLTMYSPSFSNDLDGNDARKMTNPGENWGMLRNNAVYIIERRHSIEVSDSIFFKMWNMRILNYRVQFVTTNLNFPGRTAILEDKYLNTTTEIDLNGTTDVNFSVTTDPASKAADRFRIIFRSTEAKGLLPFSFSFSKAVTRGNSVNLSWQAENMDGIQKFGIQRSSDGINFTNVNIISASAPASDYQATDYQPGSGDNYYRIAAVATNGSENYSPVMKVSVVNELQSLNVFPNPATANNFNLRFTNQPAGMYIIRLMNSFGQPVLIKELQYKGGSSVEKLQPASSLAPGIYQLEIKLPDGSRKVVSVVF